MTELIIATCIMLILCIVIVAMVARSEKRMKELDKTFEEIWRELNEQ